MVERRKIIEKAILANEDQKVRLTAQQLVEKQKIQGELSTAEENFKNLHAKLEK